MRAVGLGPGDEFAGDAAAEIDAGLVVHFKVNSGPDTRVAGFLSANANRIRVAGEQIGDHLGRERGDGGMVGRVGGKIGRGEKGHQRGIELRGTQVPIGEFPILAANPSVIIRDSQQRLGAGGGRRVQLIFEHQTI